MAEVFHAIEDGVFWHVEDRKGNIVKTFHKKYYSKEDAWAYAKGLSCDERIKELEAQLAALQWQPITESNLPKVGDELWGGRIVMALPEHYAPMVPMVEDFTFAGWTHFRAINPPAQEPK